jgi:hypothetical protein
MCENVKKFAKFFNVEPCDCRQIDSCACVLYIDFRKTEFNVYFCVDKPIKVCYDGKIVEFNCETSAKLFIENGEL